MARNDGGRLSRRQFALLGTQLVAAGVTVLLAVPIVGFLLSPLFRRAPTYEAKVGDVSQVPDGQPTKLTVSFPQGEWTSATESAAVYVVRSGANYRVFSNICTHMQCPVRWNERLRRFLCPCHGGLYDISGKNVGGPPPKPLPEYVHRIDGTTLYVQNRFTEEI